MGQRDEPGGRFGGIQHAIDAGRIGSAEQPAAAEVLIVEQGRQLDLAARIGVAVDFGGRGRVDDQAWRLAPIDRLGKHGEGQALRRFDQCWRADAVAGRQHVLQPQRIGHDHFMVEFRHAGDEPVERLVGDAAAGALVLDMGRRRCGRYPGEAWLILCRRSTATGGRANQGKDMPPTQIPVSVDSRRAAAGAGRISEALRAAMIARNLPVVAGLEGV